MNPTDEVVRALLMRCLASTGQRACALNVFESLRVLLSDQLGVSPRCWPARISKCCGRR
jgi:DNA-binding SARP family transcriptional activator